MLARREYSVNDRSNSCITWSLGISTSRARLQPSSSLTTTFINAKDLVSKEPLACWGIDPGLEPCVSKTRSSSFRIQIISGTFLRHKKGPRLPAVRDVSNLLVRLAGRDATQLQLFGWVRRGW